jgi:16S rRNA (guanine(966)-N(2))-methyltransferase RsmD
MRIIAGKYKGRVFFMPRGIRPPRIRSARPYSISWAISKASFLELFAGSGSIGFEALSRNAGEVVFVESNGACRQALERTIGALGPKNCLVYPADAEAAIKKFHRDNRKFDLIFLDPPYHGDTAKKALQTLGAYDILAPYGFIVVQSFKKESLPQAEGDLIMFRQSRYGDTVLSLYRKE